MRQPNNTSFQLEKEREELKKIYPTLQIHKRPANFNLSKHVQLEKEAFIIEGTLPITLNGEILISYEINIHIPEGFPQNRPTVYCKDKSLYNNARRKDRHINDDHSACLCVHSDYKRFLGPDYTITEFITKLVLPYFKNQNYFEAHGKWPRNGRAHGKDGIVEFIAEHTGIRDENFAKKVLLLLSRRENISPWIECPCGSKKIVKDCHGPKLWKLKHQVTPKDAQEDLLNFTAW